MSRLIAIGDIHGHKLKLDDLIEQIQPTDDDQLVFLGDYIDRGPASKQVIETLIDLKLICPRAVFLRGNHEQMFLDALISCKVIEGETLQEQSYLYARDMTRDTDVAIFKRNGGEETLKNYGVEMVRDSSDEHVMWPKYELLGEIPQEHIEFIQQTQLYYRHGDFVFVHAGYFTSPPYDREIGESIEEQAIEDPHILLWERYSGPGKNGETLVVGHSPVEGAPHVEPGRFNLDTGAGYGRQLSAMDVLTGQVWQSRPTLDDIQAENIKLGLDMPPAGKPRKKLGGIDYDD